MTDSRSRLSEAADENRQLREREKQLQLQLEQQAEQLEQQCNAGGGRLGTMEALMRAAAPQAELDELSSKANFDIFNIGTRAKDWSKNTTVVKNYLRVIRPVFQHILDLLSANCGSQRTWAAVSRAR